MATDKRNTYKILQSLILVIFMLSMYRHLGKLRLHVFMLNMSNIYILLHFLYSIPVLINIYRTSNCLTS